MLRLATFRTRALHAAWHATLVCTALAGGSTLTAVAIAAPAPFPTQTTPVLLDGTTISSPGNRARNTIVFDGGRYHLWYIGSAGLFSSASGIGYATSADGISFITAGTLTAPANWWTSNGATAEPQLGYVRVSRDGSGDWILMLWHPNSSTNGAYNYNTSLWRLGTTISNPSPTQVGPLPSGPGGNHVGPLGIVGTHLYLAQDTPGAFGRYSLPLTAPVPMPDAADAYAGTGYCWYGCVTPAQQSYIHNYGRTLDQGGVLGTYYSLREYPSGARRGKQLWYLESSDDGATWSSAAQPLFANGSAVTVDGLPNTGDFSLPEVAALGGGQYRSYFNTQDGCGNNVTVTAALPTATQGLTVTKGFNPATVAPGGESELTITLSAPAATCTPAPTTPVYTAMGFTDTLPTGMVVANVPTASTTCTGATVTATAGAGSVALSHDAALAPGASCTVTVRVTVAGAGLFHNVLPVSAIVNAQSITALADAVADLRSTPPVTPPTTPTAPTPVPALSPLAGLLLAALAGLAAWVEMRRRRVAGVQRK